MMDRPQMVSAELEIDLENLEKLNRFFGSYALVRYFLRRWLRPGRSFTAIDLCTGLGDIPRFIVNWCRMNHVAVRITAVDFQRATLELATERSKPYPEMAFLESEVFKFVPISPAVFVFCSLPLLHFADGARLSFLCRARVLSRRGGWLAVP